jgi:methylenetetrahydrofolate dehydrogenase (NADP+)/methenyltetrahydrofolate cyclohydrolase
LDELVSRDFNIIISAVGKPNTVDLLSCNTEVIIDVGISTDENGKLCGDCYNFEESSPSYTKVAMMPGGIGLLTRAVLMAHVARIDIFKE